MTRTPRPAVQVAGSICLDLLPRLPRGLILEEGALNNIGPLAIQAGGSVANTGLTLAAIGSDVVLTADIGDDLFGSMLQAQLAETHARLELNKRSGRTTSYSVVLEPPAQDRMFFHHVGANVDFDGTAVQPSAADVLHLGYPPLLPALTADGARPLRTLLERARAVGVTTSIDMAYVDPQSPAGAIDWPKLLADTLPLTDVFTPSLDDLSSTLGLVIDSDPHSLVTTAQSLVDRGAAIVLLTAGAAGLALATGSRHRLAASPVTAAVSDQWADQRLFSPAAPVNVVRTTGAGDAAAAGLLDALLRRRGPRLALACAAHTAAVRVRGDSNYTHVLDNAIDAVGSVSDHKR
ncbi:carbohydrate kinase family protein [Nocardia sp. NPDC051463]|uniref:carbohydrate kinase family protein n=1 Tax=Nocardia sp. NPDC051463 TaxID=3154845 RepID=UPI00344E5BE6